MLYSNKDNSLVSNSQTKLFFTEYLARITIKSQKSIIQLLSNKDIQLSILSAGVGYTTMSTLMTATPIHMNMMHGFTIFSTGIVLQMHVVGMFLPSLITGDLIKKFGHKKSLREIPKAFISINY